VVPEKILKTLLHVLALLHLLAHYLSIYQFLVCISWQWLITYMLLLHNGKKEDQNVKEICHLFHQTHGCLSSNLRPPILKLSHLLSHIFSFKRRGGRQS